MKSNSFKFSMSNVTLQLLIILLMHQSLKTTIPNHFSFFGTPDNYLHGVSLPTIFETLFFINLLSYFIGILPLTRVPSILLTTILKQIKVMLSIWVSTFSWCLMLFFFFDSNRLLETLLFFINASLLISCSVIVVRNLFINSK